MILLAALVALFTVAWTTTAHAEFVTMAVVGYLVSAGVVGAGTVVAGGWVAAAITFAWTTALSVGLSYLTNSLQSNEPEEPIGASSGQLQGGGLVSRSIIVGRGMTAGSLVYANTFGYAGNTPNAFLVQVIALQDLPATALAEIWVNGEKSAWNAGATAETEGIPIPFGPVSGGGGGGSASSHMWVRFYDGTQVAADARLVELFASDPDRPYENTRVGTGVTYVVVTSLVNQEIFNGFPELKFVLDGTKFYDQRLDSTQGGVGSHRLNNSTTWAHTRNPVVIASNIVLGIKYAGDWVYGAQTVAQPQLPTASWFAAANECDASIDLAGGGTEPQFQAGGEILFNQQPADTIEALLKSCNGRLAEIGGVYKIRAGAAGASVIAFTDADIYSSEQQTYDPFVGLGQTINAVNGRYVSAAEGWELKDATALLDADLELADGGRRQSADVVYGFVSSGTAVQRLMRSERDTNRAWRRHTLPMPPDMYVVEPLDTVSWTSERNGYINKTFEIIAAEDDLDMVVSLKELDPTSYDWDPETQEVPVSDGTITYTVPASQPIIAPTATGIIIQANGRKLPGLRLTWDPDVSDVDGVLYEVRRASDQVGVLTDQTDFWERGALETSQNLVGATNYEARLKYRAASSRQTTFSGWLAFTTPDVRIGLGGLEDAVGEQITRRIKEVDDKISYWSQKIASNTADQDAANAIEKARSKVNLYLTKQSLEGVIEQSVETLEAQIGGAVAVVETVQTALADFETAFGEYQVTVNGRFQDNEALASITISALATANLVVSRMSTRLEARLGGPVTISATVTITIATPAEVGWVAHGLFPGQLLRLTSTGALPSPLTSPQLAFIISAGYATNTFRIALTSGGAAINTTGTQSGTHTAEKLDQVTITIASPAVISWGAHGCVEDDEVQLDTSGTLPAPFVAGGIYYVVETGLQPNSLRLAATLGGAAINTTGGSQSGVHWAARLTSGTVQATITDTKLALASTDQAVAEAIETYDARFEDNEAAIEIHTIAIADTDEVVAGHTETFTAIYHPDTGIEATAVSTAVAESVTLAAANSQEAIAAFVDSVYASNQYGSAAGRMRFAAAATPSGALATFALEVSVASGSSNFKSSGLYIDMISGGPGGEPYARIRFNADQFVFEHPDGTDVIVIENGFLKVANNVVPGVQVYDVPGTYAFTVPTYNSLMARVYGPGGPGGGYLDGFIAHGTVGTYSAFADGSAFQLRSNPGNPSTGTPTGVGGTGGTASGGSTNTTGDQGGSGGSTIPPNGSGGASHGEDGGLVQNGPLPGLGFREGENGNTYGGGGSGGQYTNGARTMLAGGGGGGFCEKEWTSVTGPSFGASVTIKVGPGGVRASTGQSGGGGNGASGAVVIEWE